MSVNNIPTAAYALFGQIFTGESSDTITKMQVGAGTTPEALTDSALDLGYTTNGFEVAIVTASYSGSVLTFTHTFTNAGTVTRTVREVGLFSAAGQLMYRKVFALSELPNLGDVPAGKSITITATLTFRDSNYSQTLRTVDTTYYADTYYSIYVSGAASASMDLTALDTPAPICYNGIGLINPELSSFNEENGAKTWDLKCYTYDYDDITNINRFAGPVQSGVSITGMNYVISSYRAGLLAIKSTTIANTWGKHSNCYIQSPIKIEPFGTGWFYTLSIVQSAYNEVV